MEAISAEHDCIQLYRLFVTFNTEEEIDYAAKQIKNATQRLEQFLVLMLIIQIITNKDENGKNSLIGGSIWDEYSQKFKIE